MALRDYDQVIDTLRKDPVLAPLLTVVTPTLEFGGIAGNFAAGVSRTIMANGVVVEDQNALRRWNDYGFPGAPDVMSLTGTGPDAAVIGTGVARVLRLCAPLRVSDCPSPTEKPAPTGAELPADVATLTAQDAPAAGSEARERRYAQSSYWQPRRAVPPMWPACSVAKAEGQGIKELDDIYVSLHLAQAQRLLYGSAAPQATAIALQLHHTGDIPAARARLEELLSTSLKGTPLAVYDFQTLHPYYGQTVGLFTAIFGFIAVLIGAIVLFTVGNTMNAAVVERTVEIGTLRAIGLRRSGIRRLFVCEGILIGVLGAALGVTVALILAGLINHSGLTWTPPGRIEPIHLHVRVWGELRMLVDTALGLTVVAVISAWWPARRASRLQVVEALRHV
jgi:putative ABC transport system permease protein